MAKTNMKVVERGVRVMAKVFKHFTYFISLSFLLNVFFSLLFGEKKTFEVLRLGWVVVGLIG